MGCFNVACNLTSHSMYSGDAVFIGLVPSPFDEYKTGAAHMCYATAKYTPLFLPLYGSLDTYGRIDDVEDTAYVKYLQSIGIDIEQLIECNLGDESPVGEISGTFISKVALDFCKTKVFSEFGTNLQAVKWTPNLLKRLGIDIKELPKVSQYGNEILSPGYTYSDWYNTVYDADKKALTFSETADVLRGLGKDVDTLLKDIEGKSSFVLSMEDHFASSRYEVEDVKDPKLIELYRKVNGYDTDQFFRGLFGDLRLQEPYGAFIEAYYPHWKDFQRELDDLNTLNLAMAMSNKFWSPQANGMQHGSRFQEYNLAQLQLKLAAVAEMTVDYHYGATEDIFNDKNEEFFTEYPECKEEILKLLETYTEED